MPKQFGVPAIYGCNDKWRNAVITNLPKDALKVKLRFRPTRFAKAYVKTKNSIAEYVLIADGAYLKLLYQTGCNRTVKKKA